MQRQSKTKIFWLLALVLSIVIGTLVLTNTARLAVQFAPQKQAAQARSETATQADALFWHTFRNGDYAQIPRLLEVLTAAYLQTPGDAVTAAHIAWLHNWRSAERARLDTVPATITDDIMLARRYFQEAVMLDPLDARYLGFLAGHTIAEGHLHQDERLMRTGYVLLLEAIKAWPEFNLFTGGYVMSRLPSDSPRFREGLEWQWRTLDTCIAGAIDRVNPDYSAYMALETREGTKRACWNSWIAPHNFEGFFLNMGDMLVKSGDWHTAQKIYANAKLAKEYADWKYKEVLEARIKHAPDNVALFNAPNQSPHARVMIDTAFACMACHQE
ncbi:MAG: hypothetical protein AB7N91_11030 [Candidatus Tectimicrobiota bacterium]